MCLRPLNRARPTHFTMSRCLSVFSFCLHLPLELWLPKTPGGMWWGGKGSWQNVIGGWHHMRSHLHLQVCVLPGRNWKGSSASPPSPSRSPEDSQGQSAARSHRPLESQHWVRWGPLEKSPAEVTWGREVSTPPVAGTVLGPFTTVRPSSVHPKASLGWPHTPGYRGANLRPKGLQGGVEACDGWKPGQFLSSFSEFRPPFLPPYLLYRGLSGKSEVLNLTCVITQDCDLELVTPLLGSSRPHL